MERFGFSDSVKHCKVTEWCERRLCSLLRKEDGGALGVEVGRNAGSIGCSSVDVRSVVDERLKLTGM